MRTRNPFDVIKVKPSGVLDLFRHDKGARASQRSNLPVNVQHFRLQKGGAIAGDREFAHVKPLTLCEVVHVV